jgi:S-formylglutathione hydrolase FrmB
MTIPGGWSGVVRDARSCATGEPPARSSAARAGAGRRLVAAAAIALAACAGGRAGGGQPPAPAPTPAPATGAARAPTAVPRGRVVVDTVWSPALGTRKQFVVYLPPSYDREPGRRYPVAYYLHGLWGNETNWTRQGALPAAADSLAALGRGELIVVMPDGDDSWYTTWNALGNADACRADTVRREPAASYCVPWPHYDDYVARDLVARVDSAYRTRADRAHRGIAGLSMGGYGAVTLALRYPEVFAAAASHSGVLSPLFAGPRPFAEPARWAPSVDSLAVLYRGYWTTLPLAMGRDTAGWWARDPGRLAEDVRRRRPALTPALFVDVGTGDGLLEQNRAFRATLAALGVPVTYAEWPGAHTWAYWRAHVGESLAWVAARVGAPAANP